MTRVLSLANITFKEGIRNRALFGIFIMALLMFVATVILTSLFMRDLVKVAADLSLATISFSGLLMIMFIGTNLLARDIDKRTIYMVITRPISRAEYIVGKFLGLCFLVIVTTLFLGIISSLPVIASSLNYHNSQSIFSWWVYCIAIIFIALKLMLMSSVIVFFSSITSTSFISLILTVATYIIGSTNETVKSILDSKMEGLHVSPGIAAVIKGVYYIFPNLSAFDLKLHAAHGLSVPGPYIVWTFLYWLLYATILVVAGSLIIIRKEFP